MSLECPSSPVYCTSAQQKKQSKNAAKIYRYGTPKLRDLLREKCRIRVREARQCSFGKSRTMDDVLTSPNRAIDGILREELAALEHDITLQEEIYKELLDEFNEWFVEQLENEEDYMINVAESNNLICPVCQHAVLEYAAVQDGLNFGYKCECKTSFSFQGDMEQLRLALQTKIDLHEKQCLQTLIFFVEPRQNGNSTLLNALCETCDYFSTL